MCCYTIPLKPFRMRYDSKCFELINRLFYLLFGSTRLKPITRSFGADLFAIDAARRDKILLLTLWQIYNLLTSRPPALRPREGNIVSQDAETPAPIVRNRLYWPLHYGSIPINNVAVRDIRNTRGPRTEPWGTPRATLRVATAELVIEMSAQKCCRLWFNGSLSGGRDCGVAAILDLQSALLPFPCLFYAVITLLGLHDGGVQVLDRSQDCSVVMLYFMGVVEII